MPGLGLEQVADHVGRRVALAARREQLAKKRQVLPQGHHGRLRGAVRAPLAQTYGRDQAIAQTAPADRFRHRSPFAQIGRDGLSRATVPGTGFGLGICGSQVAHVAYPLAAFVDLGLGDGARQVGQLEREAGGRRPGVSPYRQVCRQGVRDSSLLYVPQQAGLFAQGKGGTDLDSGGPSS